MNYYHCSKRIWRVGDIITAPSMNTGIWVTNRPEPHFTLHVNGTNSVQKGMRLYKVMPLGKVVNGEYGDKICLKGVEVVESLGEVAKSGNMSVIERNGKCRVVKYDRDHICITGRKSHKPKWLVYEVIKNYWFGQTIHKKIRGFKRKDAAEKFAAKSENYIIKERDVNLL